MKKAIDSWLFEEYRLSYESLAIYRILYSLILLLTLVPKGMWLNKIPFAFFDPPLGFAAFSTG